MVDDIVRSVIVKILHSVEGGNVEQWLKTLEHIIVSAIAYSFSLHSTFSLLTCTLILFTFCKYFLSCNLYLLGCSQVNFNSILFVI